VNWRVIALGGTLLTLGILEARFAREIGEWQWRGGLWQRRRPREYFDFFGMTFTAQSQIGSNRLQAAALIAIGVAMVFLGFRGAQ
jgi:hypothetical protein